ncbi:MAG: hypothetical protein ACK5P7_09930 [Bdellovibrio sp.]|jgi:hypothetical protein
MKMLFFGGLLPVIAFTLIEHFKGPVWGTIAGLIFGAGEVIYELNLRLGFFFIAIAALAGWAALAWSTEAWAFLKGLGTPLLMGAYLLIEILIFRCRKMK